MKSLLPAILIAFAVAAPSAPVFAKKNSSWEYGGRHYQSRQACLRAKKKSQQRGTVVGAASAGVVAALAGGSLAETALVAGGGALVGNQIGKSAKKC